MCGCGALPRPVRRRRPPRRRRRPRHPNGGGDPPVPRPSEPGPVRARLSRPVGAARRASRAASGRAGPAPPGRSRSIRSGNRGSAPAPLRSRRRLRSAIPTRGSSAGGGSRHDGRRPPSRRNTARLASRLAQTAHGGGGARDASGRGSAEGVARATRQKRCDGCAKQASSGHLDWFFVLARSAPSSPRPRGSTIRGRARRARARAPIEMPPLRCRRRPTMPLHASGSGAIESPAPPARPTRRRRPSRSPAAPRAEPAARRDRGTIGSASATSDAHRRVDAEAHAVSRAGVNPTYTCPDRPAPHVRHRELTRGGPFRATASL